MSKLSEETLEALRYVSCLMGNFRFEELHQYNHLETREEQALSGRRIDMFDTWEQEAERLTRMWTSPDTLSGTKLLKLKLVGLANSINVSLGEEAEEPIWKKITGILMSATREVVEFERANSENEQKCP